MGGVWGRAWGSGNHGAIFRVVVVIGRAGVWGGGPWAVRKPSWTWTRLGAVLVLAAFMRSRAMIPRLVVPGTGRGAPIPTRPLVKVGKHFRALFAGLKLNSKLWARVLSFVFCVNIPRIHSTHPGIPRIPRIHASTHHDHNTTASHASTSRIPRNHGPRLHASTPCSHPRNRKPEGGGLADPRALKLFLVLQGPLTPRGGSLPPALPPFSTPLSRSPGTPLDLFPPHTHPSPNTCDAGRRNS